MSCHNLPTPHQQAGYIVHLGDHDFVLSVPVAKQSIAMLKQVAKQTYGMSDSDLNGGKFNAFRNYIASQYSFMRLQADMSKAKDPQKAATNVALSIVTK